MSQIERFCNWEDWDVDVLRYYILIQCIPVWTLIWILLTQQSQLPVYFSLQNLPPYTCRLRIICIDYTLHMSHLNILFNWFFFLFTHQKFISHWEITELRQEVKCCSECIRLVDDKLLFAIYGSPLRYWCLYPD